MFRAAEAAAAAASAVVSHPAEWEVFRAILDQQEGRESPIDGPRGDSPPRSARNAVLSFEAVRSYLASKGESEFATERAAVEYFVPGASPTRGTPRGREAASLAVQVSGGVLFSAFVDGFEPWQNSRATHRNRSARILQDMEDRSASRSKALLLKRIDHVVHGLQEHHDSSSDTGAAAAAGVRRVSVEFGLRRLVGAISLAAFTDGLASAGARTNGIDSSPAAALAGMDDAMMAEVARTASKIGMDIGDGISVPQMALSDMLLDVFDGDPSTLDRVEKILA